MGQGTLKPMLFLLIGTASSFGLWVLIEQQASRWSLIRQSKALLNRIVQEKREFMRLGFSQDDHIMKLLGNRAQRIQDRVTQLQYNWFNNNTALDTFGHNKKLEQILDVHKQMISSYIQDMQEYKKLGITQRDKMVHFAQDKVTRLTLSQADIQNQLTMHKAGKQSDFECMPKMQRMMEITKQEITYYKRLLRSYQNQKVSSADPKFAYVKEQLTDKMRRINELEKIQILYN